LHPALTSAAADRISEILPRADPNGLWVAEHGDTIVGFGFSRMTGGLWCLSQLFVRPEMQSQSLIWETDPSKADFECLRAKSQIQRVCFPGAVRTPCCQ